MTNPSPAAREARTELIAHGWLNIDDHGEVHKIIDRALERKAAEEMAYRLESLCDDETPSEVTNYRRTRGEP